MFGCKVYIHRKIKKLDTRFLVVLFMGYPSGIKRYMIMIKEGSTNKLLITRDVFLGKQKCQVSWIPKNLIPTKKSI